MEYKAICGLRICRVDYTIDSECDLLLRHISINSDDFVAHHAAHICVLVREETNVVLTAEVVRIDGHSFRKGHGKVAIGLIDSWQDQSDC